MTPRIHPKSLPITPGWLRFGTGLGRVEAKPHSQPFPKRKPEGSEEKTKGHTK